MHSEERGGSMIHSEERGGSVMYGEVSGWQHDTWSVS